MKTLIGLLIALFSSAHANDWVPPRDFLRAVCFVESSNGKYLFGDEGLSLGHFQMSEAAWLDANLWRKARRLKTYPYAENVMNPFINRVYASNYFSLLRGELSHALRRPPTFCELYAAYNLGLASFRECGFDLARVNAVTRGKCRDIQGMLVE
jgi:hypothetical protein